MNLNVTVNETCSSTPPPSPPGAWRVRAFYLTQQDAGHVYGPFSSREAAERCACNLALRAEARSAVIEEV